MSALKPLLAEAGKGAGSSFERDAGVVLRRVEEAAREARALEPDNRRVLLDVIGRVMTRTPADEGAAQPTSEPRLIVP
jgi:hypothetical protein